MEVTFVSDWGKCGHIGERFLRVYKVKVLPHNDLSCCDVLEGEVQVSKYCMTSAIKGQICLSWIIIQGISSLILGFQKCFDVINQVYKMLQYFTQMLFEKVLLPCCRLLPIVKSNLHEARDLGQLLRCVQVYVLLSVKYTIF